MKKTIRRTEITIETVEITRIRGTRPNADEDGTARNEKDHQPAQPIELGTSDMTELTGTKQTWNSD